MILQQANTTKSNNLNITIEDVKSVLIKWHLDPFATNAKTIRNITKRGSMTGIQNCLYAIRSESRSINHL